MPAVAGHRPLFDENSKTLLAVVIGIALSHVGLGDIRKAESNGRTEAGGTRSLRFRTVVIAVRILFGNCSLQGLRGSR